MLSSLLAVSWQPEIRGVVVVVLMVIVLIGGSYLGCQYQPGCTFGFPYCYVCVVRLDDGYGSSVVDIWNWIEGS